MNHGEKISGNYSNFLDIPEYSFEIKNFNEENIASSLDLNLNIESISQNKLEYEIININTNEVFLSNSQNKNKLNFEKDKMCSYQFKLVLKDTVDVVEDSLKIVIDGKYIKQEIDILNIAIDERDLEYTLLASNLDKKYTNEDVKVQINCNKKIKAVNEFELSQDKTILTKIYSENTNETVVVEDYYGHKKTIQILIENIDKSFPEISEIEEGKTYSQGKEITYKDNVGIKNIKIVNSSANQTFNMSFDSENKVIAPNMTTIIKSNSINLNYLTLAGYYTLEVTDFAGNKTIKHITIK